MRSALLEQIAAAAVVIVVVAAAAGSGLLPALAADGPSAPAALAIEAPEEPPSSAFRTTDPLGAPRPPVADARYRDDAPVFAHYYLWWTALHWRNKLGPDYDLTAEPPPVVPATLHADRCTATNGFRENTLLDVPPELYFVDEDAAATFDLHIAQAASAGIDGFAVAWPGDGTPGQTADSNRWNQRLAQMVAAVERFNAASDTEFRLMIAYQSRRADRSPRPVTEVTHDLEYLAREYPGNPMFEIAGITDRPMVIWMGSASYTPAQIRSATDTTNRRLTLIGNEHRLDGWQRGVADSFEGDHWYWSSQHPTKNPSSFDQLAALAAELHAEGKLWLAPIAPGFNISNFGLGGTCVPRDGGDTMRQLYDGNVQSRPDIWLIISWNEFLENTYIQPTVRYGSRYLDLTWEIFGPPRATSSIALVGTQ